MERRVQCVRAGRQHRNAGVAGIVQRSSMGRAWESMGALSGSPRTEGVEPKRESKTKNRPTRTWTLTMNVTAHFPVDSTLKIGLV